MPANGVANHNDSELFTTLFCDEYQKLVRTLYLAGGTDIAEDLAQDAFSILLTHWKSAQKCGSPSGYLYRCAFRLLSKQLKKRSSDNVDLTCDLGESSLGIDDFEDTVCSVDEIETIVNLLPPRARACTVAHFYLGMTSIEIGKILKITPGTVRKHLSDARTLLRENSSPK